MDTLWGNVAMRSYSGIVPMPRCFEAAPNTCEGNDSAREVGAASRPKCHGRHIG
jgi:hypothetical protein